MELRIVCAANKSLKDGRIIAGVRHWDHAMRAACHHDYASWEQGFLDNRGCFHSREGAWDVAEKAGQILRKVMAGDGVLFSENLY